MRKFLLLSCFLCLLVLFSKAQFIPLNKQHYIDSLNAVLKSNKTDSLKALACFNLSSYFNKTDTVKAKSYLAQGAKLAKNSRYMLALSKYATGMFYSKMENKAIAKGLFLKADTLLSPIRTKSAYTLRKQIWHNYARLLQFENNNKLVLDILLNKVMRFALLSGKKQHIGLTYSDIATMLQNQGEYGKAASYYEKAITVLKDVRTDSVSLIYTYLHAAQNYLNYKKPILTNDLLIKTKALLVNYTNTKYFLEYYSIEGEYFRLRKEYDKSLNSLNKGIELSERLNEDVGKESLLYQKYKVLVLLGEYQKAKGIILGILPNTVLLENRQQYYHDIAETNKSLGNMTEAYKWLDKYSILSDSINESRLKQDVNTLEIKFRNAENQKKIAQLNAANEKAKLAAKNDRLIRWLLISASLFLFIVAILGFFFYRNAKKLAIQKELNYQQQLKEVEQRQQMKIAQAVLNGQEEERNRVARDLHDGLGGMLASVKMNLSDFVSDSETDPDKKLHQIIGQLDNSLKELRRIAHNMVPEMLLKLGLKTSIKDLCESIPTDSLAIDFQSFGIKSTLLMQEQIAIYRIIQELLTNVIKHAQAENVLLQCSQDERIFLIAVEDDGKGFDNTHLAEKQGMGLFNIKNRVAYLDGQMDITSNQKKKGTIINIELHVTA